MNVAEAIRARRSIRKYKSDPIPEEHLKLILEAAMTAPSACNTRPWEFVVITNEAERRKLASLHPFAKHAAASPAVIVVCALPETQERVAKGFFPQDCGAATQNILLQAAELGYGTCWCGVYPHERLMNPIREMLGVTSVPFCLITLGVPDEAPAARGFYEEAKVRFIR
ncbi:MAG TPA: nitroreductase family protein [Clostridia bacterium]|nr:nitroreductase family protein [Clostridia bacterium]